MARQLLTSLAPGLIKELAGAFGSGGGGSGPKSDIDVESDIYKNLLDDGFPTRALEGFQRILDSRQGTLAQEAVFKLKTNIGICQLRLGDIGAAIKWLEDGSSARPEAPRAIGCNALVLILKERQRDAFLYAKRGLEKDPQNEWLAARLFHASLSLPDADPEPLVSKAVENHEQVMLWRALYLRNKGKRPEWWNVSEDGSRRFQSNRILAQFAAEAIIDRIATAQQSLGKKVVQGTERAKLIAAIEVLEKQIANLGRSEQGNRDDTSATLNSIMLAHRFLGHRVESLKIAKELIDGSEFEQILVNAVQVSLAFDDEELAEAGIAKVPESGRAAFLRGMFAFNKGKWAKAAEDFERADVPEQERMIVEAVNRLAPFADRSRIATDADLRSVFSSVSGDVRATIVVARMAASHGLGDLADELFRHALSSLKAGSPENDRQMVAAHANDAGDATSVIEALDGYVDKSVLSTELQWLADAHASENPRRERNLNFFAGLPLEIRQAPAIMRAHASRVLDTGDAKSAESMLRKVVAEMPTDPFCHLRLLQSLRTLKRDADAARLVRSTDETPFFNRPHDASMWACELRDVGEHGRALRLAYELVRRNPNSPSVALGYLSLVFGRMDDDFIPPVSQCQTDCFVELTGPDGEKDAFVIDNGTQMPGVEIVSPLSERAVRVIGKALGDEIVSQGPLGQSRTWKVTSIKSKFLHVFHVILDQFEKRFPGTDGIWRMSVSPGDIQPILDMIRGKADAMKETVVNQYVKNKLPLAFLAPAIGGEEIGLAQYLRLNDIDLAVCEGNHQEREAAISLCRSMQEQGAVLDTYTAWTCSEAGLLGPLKSWFGTISVAQSTIDRIDHLIAKEEDGLGKQGMSIGWYNGQFLRSDIDEDHIKRQISALNAVKSSLLQYCEIVAVDLPDDTDTVLASIVRKVGQGCVDPIFLASTRNALLLCEDHYYRRFAVEWKHIRGSWLQAALTAATQGGALTHEAYAQAVVQIAARRHRPVSISPEIMSIILRSGDMKAFAAISQCLGGPAADMWSHVSVAFAFLSLQWAAFPRAIGLEQATSIILSNLNSGRQDWMKWFAFLWFQSRHNEGLVHYFGRWAEGHFLTGETINEITQWYDGWSRFFARYTRSPLPPYSSLALSVSLNEAAAPGSSYRVNTPRFSGASPPCQ